ncbi:MAG: glutamine synthetase [Proteobacteria bacterium]|nr:glutamine synthetase [Pseudomonadota bacterium]
MNGKLDLETLTRLIEQGEIDTVLVCFPDMQGRLMGKRVTGHFFRDSVAKETHACDYLLAVDMEMEPVPGFKAASWDLGYGDFVIKPDMSTLRRTPWLEGTALVIGDILDHHGTPVPHAPRNILKKQLARLAERGWTAYMASELEFYVIDETYDQAREKDYKGLKYAGWYIQDYHIFQTTKEESLIRAIRNHMDACGIPVESSKGEAAPGQEEINFKYAEALDMADRHVIFKNGTKEIAFLQGKAISFMAKMDYESAGNSCHLHSSLWDTKSNTPLFYDQDAEHGMSKLFRHYLAGQLALAKEMTYCFAPTINSYKRFQSGSFAPTKAAWSLDNRTAGFRVITGGAGTRIECRIPGADCNPYLAFAATLAAGLHGIDNELELPKAFVGNMYAAKRVPDVPKTLREALAAFKKSKVLRAAFGDPVVDHYLHAGEWEQAEYDRRVTDWELIRYFERA